MPMTLFFATEMHSAHNVFRAGGFKPNYDSIITKLAKLTADKGPHVAHASVLPKLRASLQTDGNFGLIAKGKMVGVPQGMLAATGDYDASRESDYSKCNAATKDKLAALVLLKHTTLEGERGAQKVFVCSLPMSYDDWPSQVFKQKSLGQVLGYLADPTERFKPEARAELAYAVQHAQAYCQRALILLANAIQRKSLLNRNVSDLFKSQASLEQAHVHARAIVKRWFADENTKEEQIDAAIAFLQAGFKRMLTILNANRLIFTDHPQIRNALPKTEDERNLKSESFVDGTPENMSVIYVAEKFFSNMIVIKDKRDWARIVIHEAAHLAVPDLRDHGYGSNFIKPTIKYLPFAKAIRNADSWAFFAMDAAGQLTPAEQNFALRR